MWSIEPYYVVFASLFVLYLIGGCSSESEESPTNQRYKIDGKVTVPFTADQEWIGNTRVMVDGGEFLGFLRTDGGFTIHNVPSGSYVVEVSNPTYVFETTRVDITSKGKIRARRLNNIKPSAVNTVSYPLKFKARGKASYFQVREQWRVTDFLMNPMVLMMVLPFLMIMVLPKLVNTADPETQREMQSQMNMFNPKPNIPEVSEILTSWLGGSATKKSTKKPVKRRS